jgi:hypothetical protein
MAKPKNTESDPTDPDEAAVAELLAAIGEARDRAGTAYEFSEGSSYAYAVLTACNKAARLAGVPPRKRDDRRR